LQLTAGCELLFVTGSQLAVRVCKFSWLSLIAAAWAGYDKLPAGCKSLAFQLAEPDSSWAGYEKLAAGCKSLAVQLAEPDSSWAGFGKLAAGCKRLAVQLAEPDSGWAGFDKLAADCNRLAVQLPADISHLSVRDRQLAVSRWLLLMNS
jgi:hypothetical protein